jgi:hypothetical protein
MKVIGLMPVRNEAWVLPHSLASLSGFCDVVLVNDQRSEDASREICRQFPKVVLFESAETHVCEQARWELLDAARGYDGCNLLICTDADELLSPRLVNRFLDCHWQDLEPGTIVECFFYHLWGDTAHYRDDYSVYRPHWKQMAWVDDRQGDYDRSERLPLHQPRAAAVKGALVRRATDLPFLHLQWLIANRNQMKQAWYRCRELLDGKKTAAAINERYAITLPRPRVNTSPVPPEWTEDLTFPDLTIDGEPAWQERDILGWFEQYGPAFFEPLEIWHVALLRDEFRRRLSRRPRADRSYRPAWPARAQHFARRAVHAARRRMAPAARR